MEAHNILCKDKNTGAIIKCSERHYNLHIKDLMKIDKKSKDVVVEKSDSTNEEKEDTSIFSDDILKEIKVGRKKNK